MESLRLIRSLEQFPSQLNCLVSECDSADIVWKPNSDNWSILEIVCHLVDEEVDDFRMRLRLTLTQPRQTWPPIDPVRAATDRNYAAQNMVDVLERFRRERSESIQWLKSLGKANWHASYEHPKLGTIRAGDLLAAWAAHDFLHMRQITKRKFERVLAAAGEFTTDYAGGWAS